MQLTSITMIQIGNEPKNTCMMEQYVCPCFIASLSAVVKYFSLIAYNNNNNNNNNNNSR